MRPWVSKHLLYLPTQRLRGEPVLRPPARSRGARSGSPRTRCARARTSACGELVRHAARRVPSLPRGLPRPRRRSRGGARRRRPRAPPPAREGDGARARRELVAEGSDARASTAARRRDRPGIPMPVVKSRDAYARIRAIWYRYARWYGIDIGAPPGPLPRPSRRLAGRPARGRPGLHPQQAPSRSGVPDAGAHAALLAQGAARRPSTTCYGYPSAMVGLRALPRGGGRGPHALRGARRCSAPGRTSTPFQRSYLAQGVRCARRERVGLHRVGGARLRVPRGRAAAPVGRQPR